MQCFDGAIIAAGDFHISLVTLHFAHFLKLLHWLASRHEPLEHLTFGNTWRGQNRELQGVRESQGEDQHSITQVHIIHVHEYIHTHMHTHMHT